MSRMILLAGAALMTLGGPAFAQDATPMPGATDTPTTATPDATTALPVADTSTTSPTGSTDAAAGATPGSTTEPTVATQGATGADATTATAGTTTDAATSGSASASVQADWAKYDKENAGYLTPLAFGNWILAARGQDMTAQVEKTRQSKKAGLPAVKVLNATAAEFTKADADHDRKITPTELTAYLGA